MIFHIDVENCCRPWVVQSAKVLVLGVSRTVVACSGCGQRRVLTVTNVPERSAE